MYAGVISFLKAWFHRKQGSHAFDVEDIIFDEEEKCVEEIFKVEVLQAMHWYRDTWESVT